MKQRQNKERSKTLREIQEELKARGVRSVKFTFAPGAEKLGYNRVARDAVKLLQSYLDGKYIVIKKLDLEGL